VGMVVGTLLVRLGGRGRLVSPDAL
jgi:hypothetical protein